MKKVKALFKPLKYLRVQVALYYLITSLFLMVILSGVLYFSISQIMLKDALTTTAQAIERSGNYIEVYIQKLKALSRIIGENSDTRLYLTTHDASARERVLGLVQDTLNTDPFLVSVIIVSKDGELISNEVDLDMTMSGDMMDEPWYVSAINSNQMPVLTSIRQQGFSMDKKTWVISISQEITSKTGENIGVLLIDIRYQVLEDYLSGLTLGRKGYAFIVNSGNDVVYHPDTSYFGESGKKEALSMLTDMPDGYQKKMGLLLHHYPIEHTDWVLVGLSSLDNLESVQRQLLETLVLISVILLFIVIGGGLMMARRITDPILHLEKAMSTFGTDFSPAEINEKGCYEATSLALHYNAMLDRIKELMVDISKNEEYLRDYEIKALHSQINPHFLYNTLDTIIWMAEFGDNDKVIAITKSLAQFFRISLSKGKELIPLKDEFDHVLQYLFIQKQRYESKLTYDVTLDKAIGDIEVPKIILQPIVENAVYHGIREKEGPGQVKVSAEMTGDALLLVIEDDGVGFDTSHPVKSGVKLGGIGLSNVDQRIKLYFGDAYGVQVQSEIGRGTKVILKLKNNGNHPS